jgi:glutamate-1-semialdehyde 2,1-aminomutase
LLEAGVREALRALGLGLTVHRLGSMFCLFFTENPVTDLQSAQASDRAAFGRFFHGCLKRGVYLAPSQFETGFLSLAHADADIERTVEIFAAALRESVGMG